MTIKESLASLGLTEGEVEVYEALLELGQTTTGNITRKAGIASSKVYEVLQRLQEKGLASFVLQNGVRHYDATPPERLLDFLEERKENLSTRQEEIRKILPQLAAKRNAVKKENSTLVYTGKQGPKIVLKEILEAGRKGQPHYGFGTDTDPYAKHHPHALRSYIQESKKLKFPQKLIFAEGFKSPNPAAQVRHLPKEYLYPVRIMIYGNKVAIVDFTDPITTIVIEKEEIAKAYTQHFEMLWKLAS